MEGMLGLGASVLTSSGRAYEVLELLGSGSQGEVYRIARGTSQVALKWYFPAWASVGQRRMLEELTNRPPPGPSFLWPTDLVTAPGVMGFGYLMPLKEDRFRDMTDIMRRHVEPRFSAL